MDNIELRIQITNCKLFFQEAKPFEFIDARSFFMFIVSVQSHSHN